MCNHPDAKIRTAPAIVSRIKAISVSPDELLRIYEAGIRRGNEEATSWEWGSSPSGEALDELEDEMVWGHPEPILCGEMEKREEVWAEIKEAMQRGK